MTPSAEARPKSRDLSLDVAKGLGIILVVIGHAWRGLESAGMIGNAALFDLVDRLIYNFHMPLFFLLSGMTFQDWALKRPYPEAAFTRVTRLLWPLVLWSYLFAAARIAAGDAANTQVQGWQSLLFFPLPPRDHFWFLWALFLQHLVILALIRTIGLRLRPLPWAVLCVAMILTSSLAPIGLNAWTFGAATYAGAFLAGLALGPGGWPTRGTTTTAVAITLFVAMQAASFQLPPSLLAAQILGILLSLAFLAAVQGITALGQSGILRVLAQLGVMSMGIYLAHTIFSAGTRAVLGRYSQDLSLHMIAGTAAGIIGPLIIYFIIRRIGRPSWIGF
jgi:fucose 4-O-acetylase-like acetyltransferase